MAKRADRSGRYYRELADARRRILEAALARHGGSVVKAAHDLGLTETILYRHFRELGISTRLHKRQKGPVVPTRPAELSGWLGSVTTTGQEDGQRDDDD